MSGKKGSSKKAQSSSQPASASTDKKGKGAEKEEVRGPGMGKGHRGPGRIAVGKTEVTVAGITMKEWMRTPQTLLTDYCNSNKRPRPFYNRISDAKDGKLRYNCILRDPVRPGTEKDLIFIPHHSLGFDNELEAKHHVALLALHALDADRPHENRLPDVYRDLWIQLNNQKRGGGKSSSTPAAAQETNGKDRKVRGSTTPSNAESSNANSSTGKPTSLPAKTSSATSVSANISNKPSEKSSSIPIAAATPVAPALPRLAQAGSKAELKRVRTERELKQRERDNIRAMRERKKMEEQALRAVVMSAEVRDYVLRVVQHSDLFSGAKDERLGVARIAESIRPSEEALSPVLQRLRKYGFTRSQAMLGLKGALELIVRADTSLYRATRQGSFSAPFTVEAEEDNGGGSKHDFAPDGIAPSDEDPMTGSVVDPSELLEQESYIAFLRSRATPARVLTLCLHWLCLFLPEENLPSAFSPIGKNIEILNKYVHDAQKTKTTVHSEDGKEVESLSFAQTKTKLLDFPADSNSDHTSSATSSASKSSGSTGQPVSSSKQESPSSKASNGNALYSRLSPILQRLFSPYFSLFVDANDASTVPSAPESRETCDISNAYLPFRGLDPSDALILHGKTYSMLHPIISELSTPSSNAVNSDLALYKPLYTPPSLVAGAVLQTELFSRFLPDTYAFRALEHTSTPVTQAQEEVLALSMVHGTDDQDTESEQNATNRALHQAQQVWEEWNQYLDTLPSNASHSQSLPEFAPSRAPGFLQARYHCPRELVPHLLALQDASATAPEDRAAIAEVFSEHTEKYAWEWTVLALSSALPSPVTVPGMGTFGSVYVHVAYLHPVARYSEATVAPIATGASVSCVSPESVPREDGSSLDAEVDPTVLQCLYPNAVPQVWVYPLPLLPSDTLTPETFQTYLSSAPKTTPMPGTSLSRRFFSISTNAAFVAAQKTHVLGAQELNVRYSTLPTYLGALRTCNRREELPELPETGTGSILDAQPFAQAFDLSQEVAETIAKWMPYAPLLPPQVEELQRAVNALPTEDNAQQVTEASDTDPVQPAVAKKSTKAGSSTNSEANPTAPKKSAKSVGAAKSTVQPSQDPDLRDYWKKKQATPEYKAMEKIRAGLPIAPFREKIIDALENNQVTILSGMTGCGKTTQVGSYLLEHALLSRKNPRTRIVCTQPRRIAATGVARRVAEELCEPLGNLVGYQIKGEAKCRPDTPLVFMTTGVLLRKLTLGGLQDITHILVDEVHERGIDSDFLLAILKTLLKQHPKLKILLMSATLDIQALTQYYRDIVPTPIPILEVPGFMHPVTEVYLDDVLPALQFTPPELLKRVRMLDKSSGTPSTPAATPKPNEVDYKHLLAPREADRHLYMRLSQFARSREEQARYQRAASCPWLQTGGDLALLPALLVGLLASAPASTSKKTFAPGVSGNPIPHSPGNLAPYDGGGILVFLPGVAEIGSVQKQLDGELRKSHPALASKVHVYPLHAQLSPQEQYRVFQRVPPGHYKVVLSTNVAETSLTLDDITVVIDSLLVRQTSFDPATRVAKLETGWTSISSAQQRRGRAGRVSPGVVYRLVPKETFFNLPENSIPEIQRSPLSSLCLQALALGCKNLYQFFNSLLDSPPLDIVRAEVDSLLNLGVIQLSPASTNSLSDLATPSASDTPSTPTVPTSATVPFQCSEFDITTLGYHLLPFPMDAAFGKCLLYGVMLSCLHPILTIVSAFAHGSLWRPLPLDRGQEWVQDVLRARKQYEYPGSDHLSIHRVYLAWEKESGYQARQEFCRKLHVSSDALTNIQQSRREYFELLQEACYLRKARGRDLERSSEYNKYSEYPQVVIAAILSGLTMNVARIQAPPRKYTASVYGTVPLAHNPKDVKYFIPSLKDAPASQPKAQSAFSPEEVDNALETPDLTKKPSMRIIPAVEDAEVLGEASSQTPVAGADDEDAPNALLLDDDEETGADVEWKRAFIHPSSQVFHRAEFSSPWLLFGTALNIRDKIAIRDVSLLNRYSIPLFGGEITIHHESSSFNIGTKNMFTFYAEAKVCMLLYYLRQFLDETLTAKIHDPSLDFSTHPVIVAAVRLLTGGGY